MQLHFFSFKVKFRRLVFFVQNLNLNVIIIMNRCDLIVNTIDTDKKEEVWKKPGLGGLKKIKHW